MRPDDATATWETDSICDWSPQFALAQTLGMSCPCHSGSFCPSPPWSFRIQGARTRLAGIASRPALHWPATTIITGNTMLHRLKVRQLEVFATYMKLGSVTQTALELNTTQPNASKALKQVEDELGVALFLRQNGKLRPTPEADLLYEHVQRLFQQLDLIETFGVEANLARRVSLRVATLATYGSALIPMAVERFLLSHPHLQLQVDVLDGQKIHALVGQGLYDFGFIHFPLNEGDVASRTLASSGIHCLLPAVHPLASRDQIEARDLAAEPLVTYPGSIQLGAVIAKAFLDQNLTMNQTVATNHSQVVRKFVERGHGIGLVDPFAVVDLTPDSMLRAVPFRPEVMISIGVLTPLRRPLSRIGQDFIDVVQEIAMTTSGARSAS